MGKSNITHRLLCLIFLVFLIERPAIGSEGATEHSNLLRNFVRRRVESASFHISFFSYKPQLGQFTQLLNTLGSPGIDAALMPSLSIILKHTAELSSRLEIGYWTNNTQLPPPNSADLSASLVPISLNLIYHPILLHEFLPLYFGGGVGYSHLSISGSALDLIKQQGFAVDERNSGLTGYALIGLEYLALDNQLSIDIEAKRIFKTFTTSGAPSLDLDFDGTAIGVGVGLRF